MSTERNGPTSRRERFGSLAILSSEIVACRSCERLVDWRESVANVKRASFSNETYWARPLPGFGDLDASLLVVGLAPAAHGGNRTGRMFTGDRSGDFLFAGLFRAGFASIPTSTARDDDLRLLGAYVTAAVRCAPPDNHPTPTERETCAPYLSRELALLTKVRVVLSLGAFALDSLLRQQLITTTAADSSRRPRFAHGLEIDLAPLSPLGQPRTLLCSYHPSQRNVFTGLLTESMFDEVLARAKLLCGASSS